MLNKKISVDERIAQLSLPSQLLFTWIIPHLDVRGRFFANPSIIKGQICPFIKELSIKKIPHCLSEMQDLGLITIYGNGTCKYLQYNGFFKNQTLNEDRESPSDIPDPTPEQLQSNSSETPCKVKLSKDKISGFDFRKIYEQYPNKDSRKKAEQFFHSSVKTDQDFLDIQVALKKYMDHLSKNAWKKPQSAKTWFNNWKDWVNYIEPGVAKRNEFKVPVYETTPEEQEKVRQLIHETVAGMK